VLAEPVQPVVARRPSVPRPRFRGLVVKDLSVGSGAAVKKGDSVSVHYVGTRTSGTEFDRLAQDQPALLLHGRPAVRSSRDGTVALIGMKVGGRRKLTIPPDLGTVDRGAGAAIPPKATLLFDIELLSSVDASLPLRTRVVAVASMLCASPASAGGRAQHHIGLDPSLAMLKVDRQVDGERRAGLGLHYPYGINDQFNLMVEAKRGARRCEPAAGRPPRPPHPTRPMWRTPRPARLRARCAPVRPVLWSLGGRLSPLGRTLDSALVLPGADSRWPRLPAEPHWAIGLQDGSTCSSRRRARTRPTRR